MKVYLMAGSAGLLNPNHYLAASIWYLFRHRSGWLGTAAIGKTIVSSSRIDHVAARIGRSLGEVPVGFKYFLQGLLDGSLGFTGEESAGASFLSRDGAVWATHDGDPKRHALGDSTPRLLPRHPIASVPLGAHEILWQR